MILQKQLLRKSAWLDYLIVTILLLMSGNPAFMGQTRNEACILLVSGVFLVALMRKRVVVLTSRFLIVVVVFVSILIIQCQTFGFWPFHTMIGFLLRLFIGFSAVSLVRDFLGSYVRVMAFVCSMSLVFHLLAIMHVTVGIDIIDIFSPVDSVVNPYRGFHFVVHNYIYYARIQPYHVPDPFRNSSFFWEPGVFGAYILLGLVFLGGLKARMPRSTYNYYLGAHLVALLTTLSTTGYLVLPVALLFHLDLESLRRRASRRLVALMCVPILVAAGAYLWQRDFIGEKIRHQWDSVKYREQGWYRTRFGAVIYDATYVARRPLLGWGLNEKTRHMFNAGENPIGIGNGLSDFTAKFGLVGLVTVLVSVWLGAANVYEGSRRYAFLFLLFFLLVLNGEHLLDYPAYLGLMFLGPTSPTRHSICRVANLPIPGHRRNRKYSAPILRNEA